MTDTFARLAPLVAVLLLAACGGGSGGDDTAGPVTNPDTGPPAPDDAPFEPGADATPMTAALAEGDAFAATTGPAELDAALVEDGALRLSLGDEILRLSPAGDRLSNTPAEAGLTFYEGEGARALVAAAGLPSTQVGGEDALEHAAFGAWAQPNGVSPGVPGIAGFVAGVATPLETRVSSDTATDVTFAFYYDEGAAAAVERGSDGELFLVGDLTLQADLRTGIVRGSAELRDATSGEAWGRVQTGAMAIAGEAGGPADSLSTFPLNPFAGENATSSLGHAGTASGRFFGTEGEEIASTFVLNGPSEVAGAFGGQATRVGSVIID